MTQNIIIVCWILFLVYWGLSAKSVKPDQEVKKKNNNFTFFAILLVVFNIFLPTLQQRVPFLAFLSMQLIPQNQWIDLLSLLLMFVGLVIAFLARKQLGKNWSGNVVFKKNHELITAGIYGFLRHPIYTGAFCMFLGSIIAIGTSFFLLLGCLLVLFFRYKAQEEEALLTKHFPKEYPLYKKRVKAFIPFIW